MKLLCGSRNLTIKKFNWANWTGQQKQIRGGGLRRRD
jgi:hypothetical protein